MKQSSFESKHRSLWQNFEQQLKDLESNKQGEDNFPKQYRKICQHLALSQSRGYGPQLVSFLDDLVMRAHQQLYLRRYPVLSKIPEFLLRRFPQAARQNWQYILVSFGLFYGVMLLTMLWVWLQPSAVYTLLDIDSVLSMEQMYDPSNSKTGRERSSDTDFMMFGFYVQHNISIAFQTFSSGLLLTLGSLFFLVFNGLSIGAVFAHLLNVGYHNTLFPFVIGHGAFELNGICISGAAGIMLGWALLSPGRFSRLEALKRNAVAAITLMIGATVMLVIAAFLEAFWSSTVSLGANTRYAVGGLFWLLVILYFIRFGRS